jgi:hypothetical protein
MKKLKFNTAIFLSGILILNTSYAADISALKVKVNDWIAAKKTELSNFDCNSVTEYDEGNCATVTVKFSDGQFVGEKTNSNQTILIIDTNLEFPSVLRYRSRIKAAYTQNDDGIYKKNDSMGYEPSFDVPSFVSTTLQQIDNFTDDNNNPTFVPALWFRELYLTFDNKYPYYNYAQYNGHGVTPLTYLLEHNPQAELVIASPPAFFSKKSEWFCNPEHNDISGVNNLTKLEDFINEASQDFKENVIDVSAGQGINYVNYSGGFTIDTVKAQWTKTCGTYLPDDTVITALLKSMRPFYDVLFNSDGVMGFQATGVNMTEANNALDIDTSFKNRVLVGDYTTGAQDSGLLEDGYLRGWPPALVSSRNNSKKWIDVFVNFGVETRRPFPNNATPVMQTDIFGLDSFPITSMTPSWAAPVALSRAVHLRNTNMYSGDKPNDIINNIKLDMAPDICRYWNWRNNDYHGKCKMQDPLRHRQHEVYRLGFLD